LITKDWNIHLYKYITGIIQKENHKLLAINGMPDHIHILFGLRPAQSLSDLMRLVKSNSSKWIIEERFIKEKFNWQEGFGAFSYSKSQVPRVINYIQNQEIHHAKKSFLNEYKTMLAKSGVEYDEKYLFKPVEY
jgi:putative transposase